jgi:hypothetical protein
MENNKKLTSFKFTKFKIKHQKNGNHYLITPFICKQNIFLLNDDETYKIKNNSVKKICIYEDRSISVCIKISKDGKKQKYFGKDKYIVSVKELNNDNSNDFVIDDDYESDGTVIMSDSD